MYLMHQLIHLRILIQNLYMHILLHIQYQRNYR